MDGYYCLDDISMDSWPSFYSLPMSAPMGNPSTMWVEPTTSLDQETEKGTNATNSTSAVPVIVREGEEKSIGCCIVEEQADDIVEEQADDLIEAYYLPVSASTEKLNALLDSMLAESDMPKTSATSLTNSTSAAPVTVREGEEKNDCFIVGVHPSLQQPQQSAALRAAEDLSEAYLKQKLGTEVSTYLQYQESVKTGLSVGESSGDRSTVNTEAKRQPDEDMEAKVAKLMKRRESNRAAARRVRQKKKEQMEKLLEKVSSLETALVNRNAAAAAEVSQCNAKVARLENKVRMKDDWIKTVEAALRMVYGKTALELVSMAAALSGSAQPTAAAAAAVLL